MDGEERATRQIKFGPLNVDDSMKVSSPCPLFIREMIEKERDSGESSRFYWNTIIN